MYIKLTKIYGIPKLHAISIKERLAIAAPQFSVKPLSKAVAGALKLIYNQIENYNFKTQYYCGVKTFWPVQNSRTQSKT